MADVTQETAATEAQLAQMDPQMRPGPLGLVLEQRLRELIVIRDRDLLGDAGRRTTTVRVD
jgi:hypothetical protein